MATSLEELHVLKLAESLCDEVWRQVNTWDAFHRDTVGTQLVRAIDSIGANIAESFGRYHYGEKINFLYFARGSLFESKYWLNRCAARGLIEEKRVKDYAGKLTELARQLNSFASSIRMQRKSPSNSNRNSRGSIEEYVIGSDGNNFLFSEEEIANL